MTHPLDNIADLARAAREEAEKMLATTADAQGGQVRMPVEQFRALAGLLAALGRSAGACGGSDCLGAPVDGIRLFVARDAAAARFSERAAGDLML